MQGSAVGLVQPVARIEWEELDLGSLAEIRGFIHNKAPSADACLQSHEWYASTREVAQQAVGAATKSRGRPLSFGVRVSQRDMSRRFDFIGHLFLAYLPWNTVWQHNVGAAYAWGDVVPQDFSRAARWYRRAARRGDAESQYDLGFMYLLGEGVDHDPIEGVRWLERAAEQGFNGAIRLLADVFRDGAYGVTADRERSERWRLAAESAREDDET